VLAVALSGAFGGLPTRVVVVGDEDFASELMQFSDSLYNVLFLENAILWLTGNEDLLSIKARAPEAGRLDRVADPVLRRRLILAVRWSRGRVPLLVALFAAVRLARRGKKTREEPNELPGPPRYLRRPGCPGGGVRFGPAAPGGVGEARVGKPPARSPVEIAGQIQSGGRRSAPFFAPPGRRLARLEGVWPAPAVEVAGCWSDCGAAHWSAATLRAGATWAEEGFAGGAARQGLAGPPASGRERPAGRRTMRAWRDRKRCT
jgi:hypothetical protein